MLTNAYKIVDYKPLYGCIFHEYLKDYSHWGYCDSDVIFGDLSKFLTDARLNTYDRIYQHGHLCIYKNEHNINYRWKTEHNLISYNYKEVFKVKGVKMFDERGGMWDIWKENQWSQYLNDKEFADILPTKHEFTTSWNSNPMCSIINPVIYTNTKMESTKQFYPPNMNSQPVGIAILCVPLSIRSFIQIQKWNQQNRISLLAFTKKENGSSNNKP